MHACVFLSTNFCYCSQVWLLKLRFILYILRIHTHNILVSIGCEWGLVGIINKNCLRVCLERKIQKFLNCCSHYCYFESCVSCYGSSQSQFVSLSMIPIFDWTFSFIYVPWISIHFTLLVVIWISWENPFVCMLSMSRVALITKPLKL